MPQRNLLALITEAFVLAFVCVLAEGFAKVHLNRHAGRAQAQRTGGVRHCFQAALQAHRIVRHKVCALQRHRVKGHGFPVYVLLFQLNLLAEGKGCAGVQKALGNVQIHDKTSCVKQV